ncbi:417_t:CDS:2, partial [Entrophospora sp. SA101]
KRKILTKTQKKELCEKKRDNPNIKGVELAQEYGISVQSVSDILKQSSQWLEYDATYQEADDSGQNVPEVNIFDAINFISNAWDQVTTETIISSWEKTKIINNLSSINLTNEDSNRQSEVNEINDLISELPFTDNLNANEFITVDQNL